MVLLNLLKALVATLYVLCLLDERPVKLKRGIDFPKILGFDPGNSMKLLSSKIAKIFIPNIAKFYPCRASHQVRRVKDNHFEQMR